MCSLHWFMIGWRFFGSGSHPDITWSVIVAGVLVGLMLFSRTAPRRA